MSAQELDELVMNTDEKASSQTLEGPIRRPERGWE
jgi:hypothetical protein